MKNMKITPSHYSRIQSNICNSVQRSLRKFIRLRRTRIETGIKPAPLFFLGENNKKNDLVNREESPLAPIDTRNRDANASSSISSASLRFQQWHRSKKNS